MTTTFTPNRNYSLPGTGDDVNSWGPVINANFSAIDSNITGGYPISTTGGTTLLTSTQAQNLYFYVTGALTSNAIIQIPITNSFYIIANATTGNYSLTIETTTVSASTAVLGQGLFGLFLVNSGSVVQVANNAVTTPQIPSGTIMGSFLQASAPTGWVQINTFNDQVIRVVNNTGTGGATGGSWTVSGFNDNPIALTIAQIPSHNHTIELNINGHVAAGGSLAPGENTGTFTTDNTGGGGTHNHGVYNDGTWRPSFVNAIVCQKS